MMRDAAELDLRALERLIVPAEAAGEEEFAAATRQLAGLARLMSGSWRELETSGEVRDMAIRLEPEIATAVSYAWSAEGLDLALVDAAGKVAIVEGLDSEVPAYRYLDLSKQLTDGASLACAAFSADHSKVLFADSAGAVKALDFSDPSAPVMKFSRPPQGAVTDLALGPDGRTVAIAFMQPEMRDGRATIDVLKPFEAFVGDKPIGERWSRVAHYELRYGSEYRASSLSLDADCATVSFCSRNRLFSLPAEPARLESFKDTLRTDYAMGSLADARPAGARWIALHKGAVHEISGDNCGLAGTSWAGASDARSLDSKGEFVAALCPGRIALFGHDPQAPEKPFAHIGDLPLKEGERFSSMRFSPCGNFIALSGDSGIRIFSPYF